MCDIWINVLLHTSALVGPLHIVNWNERWKSEMHGETVNCTVKEWNARWNSEMHGETVKCTAKQWNARWNSEMHGETVKFTVKQWNARWNSEMHGETVKCTVKQWNPCSVLWIIVLFSVLCNNSETALVLNKSGWHTEYSIQILIISLVFY
jgi:hypothetical protein